MNDQSRTFEVMTCGDLPNATSSPALVDGASLYAAPDGPTTDLFGQALAHANPEASRASKKGSTTRVTYGHAGDLLSPSDLLQRSLENRLRVGLTGSVSCEVIWSRWDTPWGACRLKPRARARTISGIDIGLWPTVVASDDNKSPAAHLAMKERMGERDGSGSNRTAITSLNVMTKAIILGLWPTAKSSDDRIGMPARWKGELSAGGRRSNLNDAVAAIALALWPTATASDHKSRSASQATLDRNARPLREIIFALWSTIRATDGEKGGPNMSFGAGGSPLPSQVSTIANTSNAPTENGAGSLHPEFAGWEMGYPPEWLSCAPSATRSIRAPRPGS